MRTTKFGLSAILTVGLLAGSAVGVAAQSALVTGSIIEADECEPAPAGGHRCSGGRFEFDDPRLTGDYEMTTTLSMGSGVEFNFGWIETGDLRVTNDRGAWSGRILHAFAISSEPVFAGVHWVLTGEGGYEGLTAYVGDELDGEAVRGFILDESEPMEPPAD
ncbi:MAG: hypothetical protein PVH07_09760 [Chloroflexota bacterium]|jgi:hypothetical protein